MTYKLAGIIAALLALLGLTTNAVPGPTDPVVTAPPAVVDSGAPASDVLVTFLGAAASGDATTTWALLSPAERERYGNREGFSEDQLGSLATCFGACIEPTDEFEIRMDRVVDGVAVVAGLGDRKTGDKVVRRVPFAFALDRTGKTPNQDDRWRVGAGGTPSISRLDPPGGAGTVYGTVRIRLSVKADSGATIGGVNAFFDEKEVELDLARLAPKKANAKATRVLATARLDDVDAGAHRLVAVARDDKGHALARAWRLTVPELPDSPARLDPGETSPQVRVLQERLAGLGFDIEPDGYYGSDTEHAITTFQKLNGLTADGVAGPDMRRALAEPRPIKPKAEHEGTWVEVDLSHQVMLYVKDGKVDTIYDISTGRSGWRTPAGSYRIYKRISGWRQSRLGLLWYPYYFNSGIAIHGAPYVPPYPASHGCVRVTMSAMERMLEAGELYVGMPVEVYH